MHWSSVCNQLLVTLAVWSFWMKTGAGCCPEHFLQNCAEFSKRKAASFKLNANERKSPICWKSSNRAQKEFQTAVNLRMNEAPSHEDSAGRDLHNQKSTTRGKQSEIFMIFIRGLWPWLFMCILTLISRYLNLALLDISDCLLLIVKENRVWTHCQQLWLFVPPVALPWTCTAWFESNREEIQ